jgi:hypothetical protein
MKQSQCPHIIVELPSNTTGVSLCLHRSKLTEPISTILSSGTLIYGLQSNNPYSFVEVYSNQFSAEIDRAAVCFRTFCKALISRPFFVKVNMIMTMETEVSFSLWFYNSPGEYLFRNEFDLKIMESIGPFGKTDRVTVMVFGVPTEIVRIIARSGIRLDSNCLQKCPWISLRSSRPQSYSINTAQIHQPD